MVLECVRCAPDGASLDEAACALLRGAGNVSCQTADTTVAPCEFSPVARPSDARPLPYVVDLLGTAGPSVLSRVSMRRGCAQLISTRSSIRSSAQHFFFWGSQAALQQKEYRRFIDEGDQEPGLHARLCSAGLGTRVLPPPAPTTELVPLSADLGRRVKAFESPFQGRIASLATEPRSHEMEFPSQKPAVVHCEPVVL